MSASVDNTVELEDKYDCVDLEQLLNEEDDEDESGTANDVQDVNQDSGRGSKLVQLPLARVKQLMRQDPDVDRVNPEAVFLITKATELFLESFTKEIYKITARSKKKTIQMRDITACIEDVSCMQFLEGAL